MSARDDYPGLFALSEVLPDREGGEQASRALDEIDRLRRDVEVDRIAYQRDLQGLRDERDALLARRDEVMRESGRTVERLVRQIDQVRHLCDSSYGYGYVIAKIREAVADDAAYEDRLQRLIDSAVDGPPVNKFGNVIDYAPQFDDAPDPDDWLQP